jgi:uncharacterized protein YndB with AHSA1/START domain
MIKKILFCVITIIALFAGYVALLAPDVYFERRVTIAAPAPAVFEQVNDFRKWEAWSPWAKLDPDSKAEFSGPPAGEGTVMKWSGNDKVGEGKMTLIESKPAEKISIRVDFAKPFEGTGKSEFFFKPAGNQTQVTWGMSGENSFIGRAMCVIFNMRKEMETTMDRGLASMKRVAEMGKQ